MEGGYFFTSEGLEFGSRSFEGLITFVELDIDRRTPHNLFSFNVYVYIPVLLLFVQETIKSPNTY
jgi:hypothetical protein